MTERPVVLAEKNLASNLSRAERLAMLEKNSELSLTEQASLLGMSWGIDITYIPMLHGWLYLTAVLDWYSRFVISWALSQTLEMDFVLTAVDNALFQAKPKIWNSDQGSHFTSPKYLQRLQREEIKISMDARGRAMDNIFTERLWRTIKYEEVYLHEYASPKEAYRQLADYIRFYDFERPHQALAEQVHGRWVELVETRTPPMHLL